PRPARRGISPASRELRPRAPVAPGTTRGPRQAGAPRLPSHVSGNRRTRLAGRRDPVPIGPSTPRRPIPSDAAPPLRRAREASRIGEPPLFPPAFRYPVAHPWPVTSTFAGVGLRRTNLMRKHGRTRFARSTVLRVDRIIGVGTFDAAVARGAILVDRSSAEIAANGPLHDRAPSVAAEIGRASCRESGEVWVREEQVKQ